MSGRGDNNKNGASGRGASNQSNQAFGQSAHRKSNHGEQTGGKRSVPESRTRAQSANRNSSLKGRESNR